MSAELTWIGLDELKAMLKRLPADLAARAARRVEDSAQAAAAEIKAAYPDETGNLRKGVRVVTQKARGGEFTVRRVVRSGAPHATLYERGTQTRQTALGYGRGHMFSKQLGAGPRQGANIFVPIVERRRRQMLEELVTVIQESGLDVRR